MTINTRTMFIALFWSVAALLLLAITMLTLMILVHRSDIHEHSEHSLVLVDADVCCVPCPSCGVKLRVVGR